MHAKEGLYSGRGQSETFRKALTLDLLWFRGGGTTQDYRTLFSL